MLMIKPFLTSTFVLVLFFEINAQWSGLIKAGINFGTINKDYWTNDLADDTIYYQQTLIRFGLGMGVQITLSPNWILRQEVFYQTKGQGTERPDVRTLFRTNNPDILHFMSFPLSVQRRLLKDFYCGVSIQPSLYLTGSDNYYAKDSWKGWIWGSTVNIHYMFKNNIETGLEYDHDFTQYYCPGCDERFMTFRVYGMYHFQSSQRTYLHIVPN